MLQRGTRKLIRKAVILILFLFILLGNSDYSAAQQTEELLLAAWVYPVQPASIIVIKNKDITPYTDAIAGFNEVLKKAKTTFKLKYINDPDNHLSERLNPLRPDILFALGTSVTQSVSGSVEEIPIVFSMVVDPAGSGISGTNLAGVSLDIPVSTQFETLKELIPAIKTIGVLYNPVENKKNIEDAGHVARSLGLTLKPFAVNNARGIPNLEQLDIDALWFIADTTVCQPPIIKRLLLMGLKNHIPVMGISSMYVRSGALLALTCEYKDIGRQAGEIALRLLNGYEASKIGIVTPRKANLVLNLAVADRLHLKIPEAIIKKATRVYGR